MTVAGLWRYAKFHPHRCNDKGVGPPKLKFLTDLNEIWNINAPHYRSYRGRGISSETLDTVLVLSAASISTVSAVTSLSHSEAISFNCFNRFLLRNSMRNKSSAVAKMGDRLATIDMGRKFGGHAPLGEAGPHLTMSSGPRHTSVPNGILIHPVV